MKTFNDYQKVLDEINQTNFNKLTHTHICNLICSFGLEYDSRNIYDDYNIYMNQDKELGLWQRPKQLSDLILYLLKECDIKSFLEIGTYKASTFLILRQFLLTKNPNMASLTIDPNQHVDQEILDFFKINYNKITSAMIVDQFDLIFIDGDHSYEAVKLDYKKALSLSPKYILFHDIVDKYCPDVVKFWNEIKKDGLDYIEFKDSENIMGLGLIKL